MSGSDRTPATQHPTTGDPAPSPSEDTYSATVRPSAPVIPVSAKDIPTRRVESSEVGKAASFTGNSQTTLSFEKLRGVDKLDDLRIQLERWSPCATNPGAGSRFVVTGQLGRGAQGVIYSIRDRDCRREIALKTLISTACDGDDISRFIHEAQVTAQLEHPGIVPVHDFAILPDGTVFYTMKRISGRQLAEILRDDAGRPERRFDLLQLFLRVLDAMAFAHSHGVIHRDLKPRNIMVGQFGEVLVLDWGLAKVRGESSPGDQQAKGSTVTSLRTSSEITGNDIYETMVGLAVGTPAYMSPEQARGEIDKVDHRSDIYSLGVILYELLCGASPYVRGDVRRTLEQAVDGAWTRLDRQPQGRRLPRSLVAIVHKAMENEQARRYQRVEDLARDLRDFISGLAVSAHRESLAEQVARVLARHRRVIIPAVTAAAAVMLVGGFAWWRMDEAKQAGITRQVNDLRREAATHRLANPPQLDQARDSYQRILGLRPNDKETQDSLRRIEVEIEVAAKEQDKLKLAAENRAKAIRLEGEAAIAREQVRAEALAAGADPLRLDALVARLDAVKDLHVQALGLAPDLDLRNRQSSAITAVVGETERIKGEARTLRNRHEAAQRRNQAQAAAAKGELAEAVDLAREASRLDPAGSELLAELLQRREKQKEQEQAAARLEGERQNTAKNRRNADAKLELCRSAAAAGRGQEAQRLLDQARGIVPDHPQLVELAQVVERALDIEAEREAAGLVDRGSERRAAAAAFLDQINAVLGRQIDLQDLLNREADPAAGARIRDELHQVELRRRDLGEQRSSALAEALGQLHQAVARAPKSARTHEHLVRFFLDRVQEAEDAGNAAEAAAFAAQAEAYAKTAGNDIADLLAGLGTLVCAPGSAPMRVVLLAERGDRTLGPAAAPGPAAALGPVAAAAFALAPGESRKAKRGRYLVEGPSGVCLALRLRRGETRSLELAPPPRLPAGVAYIPAAPVYARDGRRIGDVAGFGLAVHEVTCGEWLDFLNDPVIYERHAEARRDARNPRLILAPRPSLDAEAPIWCQKTWPFWKKYSAEFLLEVAVQDAQGAETRVPVRREAPLGGISAEDAESYVAWRRQRDRLPWRLPTRNEWTLAVQGGDGRAHPWGDALDLGFCHSALTAGRSKRPGDLAVGSIGTDVSVQGVHDLAGGVMEFTSDRSTLDPRLRVVVGGSFADRMPDRFTAWSRREIDASQVYLSCGLRLALDVVAAKP